MTVPDMVPAGAAMPELQSYVDDARRSFEAAVEAYGRGAWEMVDFHLILLEAAAENVKNRCLVELAARYVKDGF